MNLQQLAFIRIWNIMHNTKFTQKLLRKMYNNKKLTKSMRGIETRVQEYAKKGSDNNRKEYYHIDKYLRDEATQMSINGIITDIKLR